MSYEDVRMKRIILVSLMLFVGLFMSGCINNETPEKDENSNASQQMTVKESAEENEKNDTILIDTEYYTLSVPNEWDGNFEYEVVKGEHYNYSLNFYEKQSHHDFGEGYLFGISLLTETEDYTYYPSYDVLGSLEVYRIGSYNVVVTYPTDVQFTESNAKKYNMMTEEIPAILKSMAVKDECIFSETPIEVIQENTGVYSKQD